MLKFLVNFVDMKRVEFSFGVVLLETLNKWLNNNIHMLNGFNNPDRIFSFNADELKIHMDSAKDDYYRKFVQQSFPNYAKKLITVISKEIGDFLSFHKFPTVQLRMRVSYYGIVLSQDVVIAPTRPVLLKR